MKRILILFIILFVSVFLFAESNELELNEFVLFDKNKNIFLKTGMTFSEFNKIYPNPRYIGEKIYSNITYQRYQFDGIIISISIYGGSEPYNKNILQIIVFSNNYKTKRGITIGSSKSEVITKYGEAKYNFDNSLYYVDIPGIHTESYGLKFVFDEGGYVKSIEIVAGT